MDRGIGVEPVDEREQFGFRSARGQVEVVRLDPDLLGRAALVAHVHRRGRVAAHQHDRQAGPRLAGGHARIDAGAQRIEQVLGDAAAVEDAGLLGLCRWREGGHAVGRGLRYSRGRHYRPSAAMTDPDAESDHIEAAVFRRLVEKEGLAERVLIDSAGTGEWHIGAPPDARACRAAANRGYDLATLRARQVIHRDFTAFDYILAMDQQNARDLKRLAPRGQTHKIRLFTEFGSNGASHVPDPYAGGPQGFELVLDLIEDAAQGLLRHIRTALSG